MLKLVYKVIILVAVFVAAIFFWGQNIREVTVATNATVKMEKATFPVVYLKTGEYTLNLLHGYSSNLEANVVREAMTPLASDKTFHVLIQENESNIKKVKYEVREVKNSELIDSGAISALDKTETGKSTKIKIKSNLETGKEYAVKIILITDTSKKIHFYTRIKYYEDNAFLKEKIGFVNKFHASIMDKEKADEIISYLEPQDSEESESLSKVTIHSSFDKVTWGGLKPKVITEVVPTIKEFNIETGAIELRYFVSAKTASGTEIYRVKEFYRLRYTLNRIYLLNYERTMESLFDMDLTDIEKKQLKVGIAQETDMNIVTSTDNNKMCFVREGALWYYNLPENQAVKVFSFLDEAGDYIREGYDQHNVRILNMDEGGNIDFLVYGYMNRGDYEGRVGIVLYKFYAGENRIEEQVYAPLETTYQMLKEDLNSFSYVNQKGVFYFTINNQVYSYNIIAKKLSIIAPNINDDNFIMLKKSHSIAWLDTEEPQKAKRITVLNLETEKEQVIQAEEGYTIRILGGVDTNIIYGFAKTSDIIETTDGTIVIPVKKLVIADMDGNVLKEYQKKSTYITEATVMDNVIHLDLVKKKETSGKISYRTIDPDSILTKINTIQEMIGLTYHTSKKAAKESYISLPSEFVMKELPKVVTTRNTVITEDTTLHLDDSQVKARKYYVYALGDILCAYSTPALSILKADEQMGVVISSANQIVWERGGKYKHKTIAGIQMVATGNGIDSVGACVNMLLKYNLIASDAKQLSGSDNSIYNLLKKHLDMPVNLTECTLDEVLYFVSAGRPVIAMKDATHAVLITGYDEYYVNYIDPGAGTSSRMSLTSADTMFHDAGNVFISYID